VFKYCWSVIFDMVSRVSFWLFLLTMMGKHHPSPKFGKLPAG
jgi:hypothetical protein